MINKMERIKFNNSMTLKTTTILYLLLIAFISSEAKRALSFGNRKSSGSSYTTRRQPSTSFTKPTFNTGSENSHAELAKLSYPNYNSQSNRPNIGTSQNSQPSIGWTNPNQGGHAGPPPAYSASNVPGGAHTNLHEAPPVYQKPNYAAPPPNYNQATGSHIGAGTNYHLTNNAHPSANYYPNYNVPAGATYHASGSLPPGATYYSSAAHVPGNVGYPVGGTPHYYQSPAALPPGATLLPAGSSLPQGATYYASPPQSSSGPGLGTGLIAGALGGAILGHVLTPTQTKVIEHTSSSGVPNDNSNSDRIIIINNSGQPVNATDVNGATVIQTGGQTAGVPHDSPPPLAPMASIPPSTSDVSTNVSAVASRVTTSDNNNATNTLNSVDQPPPPTGGIICVPVRVNETDPNDATKIIEVEKVACYSAPVAPQPPMQTSEKNISTSDPMLNNGMPPLAPLQEAPPKQLQDNPQPTLLGGQSPVHQAPSKGAHIYHDMYVFTMFVLLIRYLMPCNTIINY